MRRRVPCEQQLNMGQSVLRGAEKSVAKSQMLFETNVKKSEVFPERELG
jgi:hypothetical protein